MPGGFLAVVGGDFAEIGRHRRFRSPGLPGRVCMATSRVPALPEKAQASRG
jgi:hypothetical protein